MDNIAKNIGNKTTKNELHFLTIFLVFVAKLILNLNLVNLMYFMATIIIITTNDNKNPVFESVYEKSKNANIEYTNIS